MLPEMETALLDIETILPLIYATCPETLTMLPDTEVPVIANEVFVIVTVWPDI
jgi:hypothetical protein